MPLKPSTTPDASATPSTKGPVASAAVLKKIDDQMDAAFKKNVAKNRLLQAEKRQARQKT